MLDEIQLSNQKLVAARERLKFEATHDALTGTWNCAAALELLDREIVRSEREGGTVAVLMLDLDHFKWVNDQFGHHAGDLALQAVSASIAGILRSSDVLARYGGEEFLVIAPSCRAVASAWPCRTNPIQAAIGANSDWRTQGQYHCQHWNRGRFISIFVGGTDCPGRSGLV